MKKTLLMLIIAIQALAITGCVNETVPHDIYVTVYPLQYVAEEILLNTEKTVGIVPGVTSHESSVDWSPKEIIYMTESTYLFYVGANYDYYIEYQIDSIFSNKEVELVKIETETSYIEFIPGVIHKHNNEEEDEHETDEHDHDDTSLGIDPHFWISPLKVLEVSELIYDKLVLAYPDLEETMTTNYSTLVDTLQQLSDDFTDAIANLSKPIMTSTNLYGYLEHDYGLDYMPISPGYHEESEQFTSQEKQEIVDEATYHNIKYIVYEKYTSSPLSNAVFDELDALDLNPEKLEFHILQSLTDDFIEKGDNYITVMYDNLELLKTSGDYIEE
jgi:zinc transport system substrate-binding protein